jgi:hypothetical protein
MKLRQLIMADKKLRLKQLLSLSGCLQGRSNMTNSEKDFSKGKLCAKASLLFFK